MPKLVTRFFGEWHQLVGKPLSAEELELAVEPASMPSYPFFVLLICSAAIATFGLLANSAAVIIGAMIIAPLMNPIVSLSYGIVAGKLVLAIRSILTIVLGSLLTIGLAFVFTEAIGWKLAGSEIISRMKPSLLDLGVAVAAGTAAAFAYARPYVSAALAGTAIAVALVPPLCTVGITLALGQEASADAGLTLDSSGARGPFLLFLTNIIGIVLAGGLVFYFRYFRRRWLSLLTLALTCASLIVVVPPLGNSMNNLLIRNQVRRVLSVERGKIFHDEYKIRLKSLRVRLAQDEVLVRGEVVGPPSLVTQERINALRDKVSEIVGMPVVLEFGIIPETIIRSTN